MALHHNPRIVTNGLQILLDAADINSYPGSGTTWYDVISGISYIPDNNTPTFNTTGIAYVDFEASSNPGDNLKSTSLYSGINTQNEYTRIAWFNNESDSSFRPIIGNAIGNNIDMGLAIDGSRLHFRQYTNTYSNGTSAGDYGVSGNTTLSFGVWYQGAIVVNRSAQNLKMYLNGALDREVTINLIGISSNTTIMIGGPDVDAYSGGRMFDGKVATVMHYNRALTASEIEQNYLAQKSRFGL
jgi:hypothetical protein